MDVQMVNYAQRRGNLTHYVSTLHITNADDTDAGRYHCIISNEYGSAYSSRANINVYGKLNEHISVLWPNWNTKLIS